MVTEDPFQPKPFCKPTACASCTVLPVQLFVSPSAVAVVLLFSVCKCNPAGVLPATCPGGDATCLCDPTTGACLCQPNVVGTTCDQCAPGYWDLAGGKGCQLCDCDLKNTQSNQCDQARKLLCSLGTGRVMFWHDMVWTFSYEDGYLSCSPETTSLWKFAVGAVFEPLYQMRCSDTLLVSNYSLPVCFLLKWVIEMHEKVTQGKRPVSIHTGKEEIQA